MTHETLAMAGSSGLLTKDKGSQEWARWAVTEITYKQLNLVPRTVGGDRTSVLD
jgi:hypothetical protein